MRRSGSDRGEQTMSSYLSRSRGFRFREPAGPLGASSSDQNGRRGWEESPERPAGRPDLLRDERELAERHVVYRGRGAERPEHRPDEELRGHLGLCRAPIRSASPAVLWLQPALSRPFGKLILRSAWALVWAWRPDRHEEHERRKKSGNVEPPKGWLVGELPKRGRGTGQRRARG